jgi:hypothetical protein
MKQQVDNAVAAGGTRDQSRHGGAYAAETGQGRKKGGKKIGVHVLTALDGTVI